MKFTAFGHSNILATHMTTVEFTKDKDVTKRGNCIVGIKSDFNLKKLKQFLKNKEKIRITIKVEGMKEELSAKINREFYDDNEIVIRRSDFCSKRTLGVHADKACVDFNKKFVEKLRNPEQKIVVELNAS